MEMYEELLAHARQQQNFSLDQRHPQSSGDDDHPSP